MPAGPTAKMAVLQTVRQCECNNLVSGSVIRPEVFAVEGKRACCEWDNCEIFDHRRFLLRIETRDSPVFRRRFRSTQDVDRSVNERMTADFRANIDGAQNVALGVQFQDSMLVPLT